MSARAAPRANGIPHGPTDQARDGSLPEVMRRLQELTQVVQDLRSSVPSLMLDLKAAADYMGISTRQLRRLVAVQAVPFRRMGRSLRFPMAQLTARPRAPRL